MRYVSFALSAWLLVAGACDSDDADNISTCRMTTAEISISGTVSYTDYQDGKIDIFIDEDTSEVCDDGKNSQRIITPGNRVGSLVLDAPGRFETRVKVTYIEGESPPWLDITAYHNLSLDETPYCEAGGYASVSGNAPADIQIVLESGMCPLRI